MLVRMLADWVRGVRAPPPASSSSEALHEMLERARRLVAADELARAEAEVREALRIDERCADAHRVLGSILGAAGRLPEARSALERAIAIEPDHAGGLTDLGNVHFLAGEIAAAEHCFRSALDHEPSNRVARLGLARVDERMGREASAIAALHTLLEPPASPAALQMVVRLLERQGRVREAKRVCAEVLDREPGHGAAEAALGFLLVKRELDPEAALVHLDRALAAGFRDEDTLSNRGIALQDLGRLTEAVECYDAALRLRADHHPARFHRALARLLRGEFEQAWQDYAVRLHSEDAPKPPVERPVWTGRNLPADATLLVYGEQGIGDQIMFASCLPDLMTRCPEVILTCADKLEPIFRRSFPRIEVVGETASRAPANAGRMQNASMVAAIGSLPMDFRRSLAEFPRHDGYLRADADLSAHYRARLQSIGSGLKIGISWRGGTERSRRAMRSLDRPLVAAILDTPGVHFVNLQYDSDGCDPEIGDAVARGRVTHWPEALADYDHTAALVASLDLVVSVCTSVIHLAGALGRAVWVMAPFSPEWRYGIQGENMPWYPSATVIRQRAHGDWNSVVSEVRARLQAPVA